MKKRKKQKMGTAKSFSVVDTEQDTWISTSFPQPEPKDHAPNRKDRNACACRCTYAYNTIKSFLCRIFKKS